MVAMLIVSFALHCDIYTTSVFVARIRKSVLECGALEYRWGNVIHDSSFLRKSFFSQISFLQLTWFAWFAMFSQFLFALAYSWPTSPDIGKLKRGETVGERPVKYEIVDSRNDVAVYSVCMKRHQGHGRALMALADSGRMNCLNWQDDYYLQEAEVDWSLEHVTLEMRRTNFRFFFFAFQAVLVPNLQVTFLGMQKTSFKHSGQQADWFTLISITISVLSGMHYIYYEYGSVSRHYQYVRLAFDKAIALAATNRDNEIHWNALKALKRARFSWWLNRVICLFFGVIFLQLITKTAMAMVVRESGVWNSKFFVNGTFDLDAGCVPMADFHPFNCSSGTVEQAP